MQSLDVVVFGEAIYIRAPRGIERSYPRSAFLSPASASSSSVFSAVALRNID